MECDNPIIVYWFGLCQDWHLGLHTQMKNNYLVLFADITQAATWVEGSNRVKP
ncbi:MAG: hypothetical protein ABIF11_04130 [Nitrospirota bacterium]